MFESSNRINEVDISNLDLIEIDRNIFLVSQSICKINCLNTKGTGFFIKLKKWNEDLYFSVTNEHCLAEDIVKSKENIEIIYDFESKKSEINLNKDKRFIKDYTDININIIIIQILEDDNIDKKYFLSPYIGEISNLKGQRISIAQFPKDQKLCYSRGYIIGIENYKLFHNASTNLGSEGSPIFLENTREVIGIHKQGNTELPMNYAELLYPVTELIKWNNKIEYNLKENNKKYIYEDGEYYIGGRLNGLKHGIGAIYYKNGKIKYKGYFIKDEFEGIGKYIYENGEYYIGKWLNGLKHGFGRIYYNNGKIKYEGNFIKDKFEGFGKYIYENDENYFGE